MNIINLFSCFHLKSKNLFLKRHLTTHTEKKTVVSCCLYTISIMLLLGSFSSMLQTTQYSSALPINKFVNIKLLHMNSLGNHVIMYYVNIHTMKNTISGVFWNYNKSLLHYFLPLSTYFLLCVFFFLYPLDSIYRGILHDIDYNGIKELQQHYNG